MKPLILRSELDTHKFAELVGLHLGGRASLGLVGDLGAGKTTFVRYLLEALGSPSQQVSSPSFSLENEYLLPSGLRVEHWDLYRLNELPIELYESPPDNTLRVIEWPDRIEGYVQSLDLVLCIEIQEEALREVRISGPEALAIEKSVRGNFK
jgi:tRNA threonylcarbamoyladenosine biosynthesis protein TsaE